MSAGFENATTKSAEVNGAPGRSSRHISSSLDRGAGSGIAGMEVPGHSRI